MLNYQITNRTWGYYKILYDPHHQLKIKELVVTPKHSLSMQQHDMRHELWFVSDGTATVWTLKNGLKSLLGNFEKYSTISIDRNQWHQLENLQDSELKIIEIQYGENCVEEDIHRITL